MEPIAAWLEKLGLSEYAPRFAEDDIDISVLPHLNDQLKQAHVAPLIVSQVDPSEVDPDENSVVSQ